MSALFRIAYAAHANGTHHKLALDALRTIELPEAEAWRRVVLKHIGKYLQGSKDPDNVFKDFKNHVLHVADNYWGGAPEKVAEWYGKVVTALKDQKWEEAVYAAGVLSHYLTDPVMPFHTGQTEAENNIHRAAEWSINRSYDALRRIGEETYINLDVQIPAGAGWLKAMTLNAAEFSHRYYGTLLAHYDITRGVVVPEDGFDPMARKVIAELLIYAAKLHGTVLTRAILESGAAAPEVTLTVETLVAALNVPAKWIEKRLINAEDKKLVQAMYDELKATGRVEKTLAEDDRAVRDTHASEVLAQQLAGREAQRASRIAGNSGKPAAGTARPLPAPLAPAKPAVAAAPPPPNVAVRAPSPTPALQKVAAPTATQVPALPKVVTAALTPVPAAAPREAAAPSRAHAPVSAHATAPVQEQKTAALRPYAAHLERDEADDDIRVYLHASDDLEDAPSIGPKMAEKFAGLGIKTVGEFIGHDPFTMAELLDDDRIDAETLTDWQDQAQLVMSVPGLRGTHAQLLVGAGYRTPEGIADADRVGFSADVMKFAATNEGKRILRNGDPPDLEKIIGWIEAAKLAFAA